MVIEQEVETMELEVEENPDVEYVKDLSARLLIEVDDYLAVHQNTLNLVDVRAKLDSYSGGDFSASGIDFTCLNQMVNFVTGRLGRKREFGADIDRLAEVRANLQNERS